MAATLKYEVVGEGDPLIFMHGLGADRRQTTSALAGLERIRLIAPDCRSHGESMHHGVADLSFDQFADDAISILSKPAKRPCRL